MDSYEWLDPAILTLRRLVLPVAIIIMAASLRGFLIFTWRQTVMSGFRAVTFLVAATATSFQSGYVLEGLISPPGHPRQVMSLMLLLACLGMCAAGLIFFRKVEINNQDALFDAIEVTGPIADLWSVDRKAALLLAKEARELTKAKILED